MTTPVTAEVLTKQVTAISKNIATLTTRISSDLKELKAAKRAKVKKYESTKRKLKLSAEHFHRYLNEVDCLFEYLCNEDLEKTIQESTEGAKSVFDQLQKCIDRAKTDYEAFQNICKEAEEKCQKGASACESYSVLTFKKRSDRTKSGRNLVVNQLLVGAGGLVTVVVLVSVLASGSASFNATTATSLVVSLLVSAILIVSAIVFIVLVMKKRRDYDEIYHFFDDIQQRFKGLDEQIVNLRQILMSELHSHVLTVETLLASSKELLAADKDSSAENMLKANFTIMSSIGKEYRKVSQVLHESLNEFFALRYMPDEAELTQDMTGEQKSARRGSAHIPPPPPQQNANAAVSKNGLVTEDNAYELQLLRGDHSDEMMKQEH